MLRTKGTITMALIGVISLTGCQSSQIYSGDKNLGMFVAIPHGWKKISQEQLHTRELQATTVGAKERAQSVIFQEAYSLDPKTSPAEVFSIKAPQDAIVLLRSRYLTGDEMNSVSYNWLRDVVFPLTTWLSNPTAKTPQYQLIDDLENVQNKARGVRTVYSVVDSDKVSQTISQTALVSDDRTKIYVLLIRARTSWYQKNASIVSKIAKSFTVRGNK
ncbi:MAG: hypothetical protein NTZ31_00435 [Actinobacteria bacterium]|nr:hypothetical protein [Actinomycetota bacterium]